MDAESIAKLNGLPEYLKANILGQEEPLSEICGLIQRSFLGLRFPGRPVASMLLAGPTGVGKTETVNLVTRYFYGFANKLIRLDMSEFQNQNALGLLIGNNVGDIGLLGYHCGKTGGSGVLLFDEIEKAHPLIMDIFLQILSAARFTLANGSTLDLSKYMVIATTNIGSMMLMQSKSTDRETVVRRALQVCLMGDSNGVSMRPEVFGRFDLRAVFNKLDWDTLNHVGEYQAGQCVGVINAKGHAIEASQDVIGYIQREGYSEQFGARPMQQAAMRILGDVVAKEMLEGTQEVSGVVQYDARTKKCWLDARP